MLSEWLAKDVSLRSWVVFIWIARRSVVVYSARIDWLSDFIISQTCKGPRNSHRLHWKNELISYVTILVPFGSFSSFCRCFYAVRLSRTALRSRYLGWNTHFSSMKSEQLIKYTLSTESRYFIIQVTCVVQKKMFYSLPRVANTTLRNDGHRVAQGNGKDWLLVIM